MCLIIQGSPKKFNREIISKAFQRNSDGFGLMYIDKKSKRIVSKKFYTKKLNKKILNRNFLNAHMLNYHAERIYYLLTRHFSYTNSKEAFNILSNFDVAIRNFKLVLPTDYKRALSNNEQVYKVNARKKG